MTCSSDVVIFGSSAFVFNIVFSDQDAIPGEEVAQSDRTERHYFLSHRQERNGTVAR